MIMNIKHKCTMIAFKHQLTGAFPIEFGLPDWHIIDWEDRDLWDPEFYFQVNVKKPWVDEPVYDYILDSGKPYLVLELTMFRENSYTSNNPDNWYYTLGWYHFMRDGKYGNENSPSDRWERIQKEQNITVKPWRGGSKGSYILLILQKKSDSTLNSLYDNFEKYAQWVRVTCMQLRKTYPDVEIKIRPHIKTGASSWHKTINEIENVSVSTTWNKREQFEGGKGLQADLKDAMFVVSYNSNTLTQSVLEGIPSFAIDDNAMAAPVCVKWDYIKKPHKAKDIDRDQWLYDSAYTQWTIAEIRDGTAWKHLKKIKF